jgi:group I intron endonuclease
MNIEKCGFIYKATNLINGKIYVGQTTKSLKVRIKSHYDSHKTPKIIFHKALKKYGFENFEWCVIDSANSQNELDIKEKFWIEFYQTYIGYKHSNGYNATTGGKSGFRFTNDSLNKMSQSQAEWIKTHGHPRGMLNKNHSKETIEKFKIINSRANNGNSKPVVKLDKNGVLIKKYDCMRDASDELQKELDNYNINAVPHIGNCCKYKNKSAYGYIWMYEEDYNNGNVNIQKSKCKKSVIQLTINGEFVKEFESIKEASAHIGINANNLSRCLNGKTKTCKGYKWIYKEINNNGGKDI